MLALAEKPHVSPQKSRKPHSTPEQRAIATEIARSIRHSLRQATKLKDLSFKAAIEIAEGNLSTDEAVEARARAQAIIALTKSWAESVNAIRVFKGKPLPGSLKPEAKPKKSKTKPQQFQEEMPE